jgi:uncharacterized protein (DUF302 family)
MTPLSDTTFTLTGTTALHFDEAVALARRALADEGFGVLTEIDVRATLKQRLGEDVPPYLILGACSPQDAHRALALEPELGALLPCNVVVYTQADGTTRVSAADPVAMLGVVGRRDLEQIADGIQERVERALERVWAA